MRLIVLWAVVVACCAATGCGPFVVKTGPESCELAVEELDDFDGQLKHNVFHYDDNFRALGLTRSKDSTTLLIMWASPGLVSGDIPAGAEIEVAFEDGAKLVFVTERSSPKIEGMTNDPVTEYVSVFSQWVTRVKVDPRQLEQLAKSPIKAMRTEAGPGAWQKALPDVGARLQTLAICLARYSG